MAVDKKHKEKKRINCKWREGKLDEKAAEKEAIDREILENTIALNRDKALPVEGYKPLFKELHKQRPTERRY
jgi:hypothetical protein